MDAPVLAKSLDELKLRQSVQDTLPGDRGSNQIRQTPGVCYAYVAPRTPHSPSLVALSDEMVDALELHPQITASPEFLHLVSGGELPEGMDPYAWCYGGHQFGHWAGQLGDGRAINLGEVLGRGNSHYVLQLKGAGKTPYSRTADGLAVLRSSLREFLCSEAMHHLGVPTTRALSLALTGEEVIRDMFYNGNARAEPGAVVCRVAPSFVRFGNFEIHTARGETELLKTLANYTIRQDFPHLDEPTRSDDPTDIYIEWFNEICRRTADLMVHWMRVGFCHGVMNTDNMSILGLTIDYGPYGWLEDYDPNWTPNTTDASGRRYAFGNQPRIALWNLNQLANALYPLINKTEPLEAALSAFAERYNDRWRSMMANKLGLIDFREGDEALIKEVIEILSHVETDMTLFFRALAKAGDPGDTRALFKCAWYQEDEINDEYLNRLDHWLNDYRTRLSSDNELSDARMRRMNAVNPKYVLRNYLAQVAIDAAESGDFKEVHRLLDVMRRPYDEQPEYESYAARRPEWARNRPGCSMLSCSS